jgi:hypothetical protein
MSSRVTTPFGPVGATVARSMPRSLASLRTGGLASGRSAAGTTAGAAGAAAGAWGAAGVACPFSAGCAWPAPACCLRGRRVVADGATPYPTSTAWRLGASAAGSSAAGAGAGAGTSATGAPAAGAAPSPSPGPASTTMIVVPTSTVVPSSKRISLTTPS